MKLTSAQAFKFLTSKIHPPLPRTPRESQQLLSLLTSSFRRQLDREHPPVQPAEPQAPAQLLSSSTPPDNPINADQHLSSILDHPLFSTVPHRSSLGQKRNGNAHGDNGAIPAAEDPMLVLNRAIASGAADANTLHGCLCRHRLQIDRLPRGTMRDRLRHSAVGASIASWFSSADSQSRNDFFHNQLTVRFAMAYMVNERYRSTVMKWLEEIRHQAPCTSPSNKIFTRSPQFIVLFEYVSAECKYGDGIVPALQFFMETCRVPTLENDDDVLPPYMLSVVSRLAQWICSMPATKAKAIPEQLYHDFSQLFQKTSESPVQTREDYWKAMLALHHPVNPSPDLALEHAEALSHSEALSKRHHSAFLRLYLEASQLCIKQEDYSKASRLMSAAKDLLPTTGSKNANSGSGEQNALFMMGDAQNRLIPT